MGLCFGCRRGTTIDYISREPTPTLEYLEEESSFASDNYDISPPPLDPTLCLYPVIDGYPFRGSTSYPRG